MLQQSQACHRNMLTPTVRNPRQDLRNAEGSAINHRIWNMEQRVGVAHACLPQSAFRQDSSRHTAPFVRKHPLGKLKAVRKRLIRGR